MLNVSALNFSQTIIKLDSQLYYLVELPRLISGGLSHL